MQYTHILLFSPESDILISLRELIIFIMHYKF